MLFVAQELSVPDFVSNKVPAKFIPFSVVRLCMPHPTREQVAELLATRSQRALQSVQFEMVDDAKVAALVAELVCTDRHKQWAYRGKFADGAGDGFCQMAIDSYNSNHFCSLLDLEAGFRYPEFSAFARLLCTIPTLHSCQMNYCDVRPHPLFS